MKKEEVRKLMEEFLACVREEQELREQLLDLDFFSESEKEVLAAAETQDDLIKNIEMIREDRVLPIVNKLMEFIASQKDRPPPPPEPEDRMEPRKQKPGRKVKTLQKKAVQQKKAPPRKAPGQQKPPLKKAPAPRKAAPRKKR